MLSEVIRPAPAKNARRRMVRGKHRAIRLGLSIAVILLCAAPVGMRAQARFDASFRILENGAAIGSATVAVARFRVCEREPMSSCPIARQRSGQTGSRRV